MRKEVRIVFRVVSLGAVVAAAVLMLVEPDLRHQYGFGSIRVTRYALTQTLLLVFIVVGVAELMIDLGSRHHSSSRP